MKDEYEKPVTDKSEVQKQYVMVRIKTFASLFILNIKIFIVNNIVLVVLSSQYYEMLYGLNLEVNKKVSFFYLLQEILRLNLFLIVNSIKTPEAT